MNMDMGGEAAAPLKCSMNMLWNWQIRGTCIIWETWKISNTWQFVLTCFGIAVIAFAYESIQAAIRETDRRVALRLSSQVSDHESQPGVAKAADGSPENSFVASETLANTPLPLLVRLLRALSYSLTVTLSAFIMLIYMTYNGYVVLAVVVGAGLGHFTFHRKFSSLTVGNVQPSCH